MKLKISLLFLLAALCLSCDDKLEPIEYTIDEKANFTAEIDGRTVSIIESDSLIADSTFIYCDTKRGRMFGTQDYVIETWNMMLGALLHYELDFLPSNVISVRFVSHFAETLYEDTIPRSLFEQVLTTGNKMYTNNPEDVSGVIIEWYDQDGVKWTTNHPNGTDDTGNYFTINYSTHQNTLYKYNNIMTTGLSDNFAHIQYLDVSFGCKLYNDEGQSILLKNGKMKANLVVLKHIY
jgi:hypothetical protein